MIFLTKQGWYGTTILGLLFLIGACFYLDEVKLNTQFEDFFPKKSVAWETYGNYTSLFGDDQNQLFIAIYHSKSVFEVPFLQKLDAFSDSLKQHPATKNILSPTDLKIPLPTSFGVFSSQLLSKNDAEQLISDSIRLAKFPIIHDLFFSKDNTAVVLKAGYDTDLTETELQNYFSNVKDLLTQYELEGTLLGNGYLEWSFKQFLQNEMGIVALLSLFFILLVLAFLFRNATLVLLSTLTVLITFLVFYGILGFFQWEIGILGNLYPTIIIVLGISDSIHFLHYYGVKLREGKGIEEAVRETLISKGRALFYTSFTTFVGFITMSFAPMPALRQFGGQAGLAVILAFVITISLLPSVLVFFQLKKPFLKLRLTNGLYRPFFNIYRFLQARKYAGEAIFLVLLLIIGVGIYLINTNNPLITSIPKKQGIKSEYLQFEQKFGAYRNIEWLIEVKNDQSLKNLEVLEQVKKFHAALDSIPELFRVSSPYSYFAALNQIFHPSKKDVYLLPESQKELNKMSHQARSFARIYRGNFMDSTHVFGKVTVGIPDIGRKEVAKIREKIQSKINQLSLDALSITATGRDLLMDEGHRLRIKDMFLNLTFAILVFVLLLWTIFKNWKMAGLGLLANIVPLLLIAATMGFSGIELRGTSTIIFIVGFVIVVDDTIHFIATFWAYFRKNKSVDAALEATFLETGQAIILTTLTLMGGFLILLTSSFWDIWVHGVLISLMLLFALWMDLILLPLLIKKFFKNG